MVQLIFWLSKCTIQTQKTWLTYWNWNSPSGQQLITSNKYKFKFKHLHSKVFTFNRTSILSVLFRCFSSSYLLLALAERRCCAYEPWQNTSSCPHPQPAPSSAGAMRFLPSADPGTDLCGWRISRLGRSADPGSASNCARCVWCPIAARTHSGRTGWNVWLLRKSSWELCPSQIEPPQGILGLGHSELQKEDRKRKSI